MAESRPRDSSNLSLGKKGSEGFSFCKRKMSFWTCHWVTKAKFCFVWIFLVDTRGGGGAKTRRGNGRKRWETQRTEDTLINKVWGNNKVITRHSKAQGAKLKAMRKMTKVDGFLGVLGAQRQGWRQADLESTLQAQRVRWSTYELKMHCAKFICSTIRCQLCRVGWKSGAELAQF